MLGCGRPVVIVPYSGRFDSIGKRALIAWTETRESVRAVGDAMPLLRGAEQVTVLRIGPAHEIGDDQSRLTRNLVHHLQRHDIPAKTSYIASGQIGTSDLILSHAADIGCDLLVMGGYGHSRTRELVLGGVTHDVLQHMTMPVLMSH